MKTNETLIKDDLFQRVELKEFESEKLSVEPYSYWTSVFREFIKKPSAVFSLALMVIVVLCTIFVPIISKYDPNNVTTEMLKNRYALPSLKHLFGTDNSGFDIFTRVWVGARTSLMIALVVSLINTFAGVVVGSIWGYFRQLDLIFQEIYNFITNIPSMLYYMILAYAFQSIGVSPIVSIIIAMTLIGWIDLARLIRNQILIFNNREYNIASRTLGTPPSRIIIYNLLPYILTVIITSVSLSIPGVIGTEVALSYLGIGLPADQISLGRIITDAYHYWDQHPHVLFIPAAVVGLITIVFYLLGLTLSDALDPKTHQ